AVAEQLANVAAALKDDPAIGALPTSAAVERYLGLRPAACRLADSPACQSPAGGWRGWLVHPCSQALLDEPAAHPAYRPFGLNFVVWRSNSTFTKQRSSSRRGSASTATDIAA